MKVGRVAKRIGCANFSIRRQPLRFWRSGKEESVELQSTGYKPFGRLQESNAAPEDQEREANQSAGEIYAAEQNAVQEEDQFAKEKERARLDYETPRDQANLSAIDRQYAVQPDVPRRIHILGMGSIGKLVAHSLRSLPQPPPVTLLLHRPQLIEAWERSKKQITIHDDGYDVARDGFDVELSPQERMEHGVLLKDGTPSVYEVATDEVRPHEVAKQLEEQQQRRDARSRPKSANRRRIEETYMATDPIHNLIVTTKAPFTVPALSRLTSRLLPTSTITFLQNGMGVIDEVNAKLFPDPTTRPNYAQGIITHGANVPPQKAEEDPFYAVHAGHGTIALSLLPREAPPKDASAPEVDPNRSRTWKWAPTSRYAVRTLSRSPVLCAVGFTPIELLQQQLEKLAVNSVINPLTALLDARNGSLIYNFAMSRTTRLLLAETSHVIRSLPELEGVPNVQRRFSPERLETLVVSVANKTKDNISSMLADVRAGRQTEIEYINGYIVRRGEEMGVKCVVNYAFMQMVMGKVRVVDKERRGEMV